MNSEENPSFDMTNNTLRFPDEHTPFVIDELDQDAFVASFLGTTAPAGQSNNFGGLSSPIFSDEESFQQFSTTSKDQPLPGFGHANDSQPPHKLPYTNKIPPLPASTRAHSELFGTKIENTSTTCSKRTRDNNNQQSPIPPLAMSGFDALLNYSSNKRQRKLSKPPQDPSSMYNTTTSTSSTSTPSLIQRTSTEINNESIFQKAMETRQLPSVCLDQHQFIKFSNTNLSMAGSSTTHAKRPLIVQNCNNTQYPYTIVLDQPLPSEIRTRTPSESRFFGVGGRLVGDFLGCHSVVISTHYDNNMPLHDHPKVKTSGKRKKCGNVPPPTILQGKKKVVVDPNTGAFQFKELSFKEASTKHEEREFCFEFGVFDTQNNPTGFKLRTTAFYAFSHKKVLSRRREIRLDYLSTNWGTIYGGQELYLIGMPFIRGPLLQIRVTTPHGNVYLRLIEKQLIRYSESVLVFKLPRYPAKQFEQIENSTNTYESWIAVSNDGRSYSEPKKFVYTSSLNIPECILQELKDQFDKDWKFWQTYQALY